VINNWFAPENADSLW